MELIMMSMMRPVSASNLYVSVGASSVSVVAALVICGKRLRLEAPAEGLRTSTTLPACGLPSLASLMGCTPGCCNGRCNDILWEGMCRGAGDWMAEGARRREPC